LENRNDPDLVQEFLKKWWVESDFKAPNLPLSLRLKGKGNSFNLYMHAYYHMENNISVRQFVWMSLEGVIALIEYLIKMGGDICYSVKNNF
jgi:hypothetical protein